MKTKSIFSKILVPALAVVIVFPLLSCAIFYVCASKYATQEALSNLIELREDIVPIMLESFNKESEESTRQQVAGFVRQAGPIIRNKDTDASLMLFAGDYKVIYPRDESEKLEAEPIAEAFAKYIEENKKSYGDSEAVRIRAANGETYLANIYIPPIRSRQIEYVITYCTVLRIDRWIAKASVLVLCISLVAAAFMAGVLWLVARHISMQFKRLGVEAKRIGSGDFKKVLLATDFKEANELKDAMNNMAQMLSQARDAEKKFYQNVSHDLRTPLMSIGGYAQGIEMGILDDSKKAAHIISEESARLTKYVSDLMTLSRLEMGEDVNLSSINLSDCIDDVYAHMNGLAIKNNIVLEKIEFDSKLCAMADEQQLSSILDNLISNAIRYAKTKVQIAADTIHVEDKEMVRVLVSDDGCGIKEDAIEHIFERSYKGEKGGFGFGLAIAYNAAKNMNGSITACNNEAGGATFTLLLHSLSDK